jgi:tripartite-type tricarboxylate transporter receptor subunit TctC
MDSNPRDCALREMIAIDRMVLGGFAFLVFGFLACAQAFGQRVDPYPSKPVRIVVGFPPGGSSDVSARLVAEKMSEEWRQPVLVENKAGAGGTIAAALVAAAPADGYTILHVGPGTHAITSALYKNLPYDALRGFTGIGQIATAPFVVVVSAGSSVKSMKELLDLARSRPGQISYGSTGSGAGPNIVTEIVALSTGVRFLHVPFKGAAPAVAAALAGHVHFAMADSASAIAHVQDGRLRALAVTTERRSPLYRDVPTIAETAVPGFAYPSSVGFIAPAGTPHEVVGRFNAALGRALANDEVRNRLNRLGFDASPMTPEEFDAFIAGEVRKYTKIVKDMGLRLD